MNVIHVNYSRSGGAGKVAESLCEEQRYGDGIKSNFIFKISNQLKSSITADLTTLLFATIDNILVKRSSVPILISLFRSRGNKKLYKKIKNSKAIIHLHWINGILSYENIQNLVKRNCKIIWTLHDMEFLTGGCHHSLECNQYETKCLACPIVRRGAKNLIKRNYERKSQFQEWHKIKFVVPSNWMKEKFERNQNLIGISANVIPNPINERFFSHETSQEMRKLLEISDNTFTVGFISTWIENPMKGFEDLIDVLSEVAISSEKEILLLTVGKSTRNTDRDEIRTINFGEVSDISELCEIYSLFDLNVSMSRAETFGLTIAECMALGVPSLVIRGTASEELIINYQNGLICDSKESAVTEIKKMLNNEISLSKKENLRRHAYKKWNVKNVNRQYMELYY